MKSLIPMGCILQHLKNFTHVYHFETSKPLKKQRKNKEKEKTRKNKNRCDQK